MAVAAVSRSFFILPTRYHVVIILTVPKTPLGFERDSLQTADSRLQSLRLAQAMLAFKTYELFETLPGERNPKLLRLDSYLGPKEAEEASTSVLCHSGSTLHASCQRRALLCGQRRRHPASRPARLGLGRQSLARARLRVRRARQLLPAMRARLHRRLTWMLLLHWQRMARRT